MQFNYIIHNTDIDSVKDYNKAVGALEAAKKNSGHLNLAQKITLYNELAERCENLLEEVRQELAELEESPLNKFQ